MQKKTALQQQFELGGADTSSSGDPVRDNALVFELMAAAAGGLHSGEGSVVVVSAVSRSLVNLFTLICNFDFCHKQIQSLIQFG